MEIPQNGHILIQFVDNVMDNKDHTVAALTLRGGLVHRIEVIREGIHGTSHLMGYTIKQLEQDADNDPTGAHPEVYFNIYLLRPYKGES